MEVDDDSAIKDALHISIHPVSRFFYEEFYEESFRLSHVSPRLTFVALARDCEHV